MKNLLLFLIIVAFVSCQEKNDISSIDPVNWDKREVKNLPVDSLLVSGQTYLSIYSQIYSQTEHRIHNLTATVSLRNTNVNDTIYINKADYYNTNGNLIRSYFDKTIFIAPMETVEIVIDEVDQEGGTGANFIFDWKVHQKSHEPLFEGVMISTYGQQGLSFTTQGKRIK
ncbi:DUF3124 domain-containing protein [Psychroserpens sp. XS_ASV72]|uniref:DUF3124 domain-containing protein n=1 Tax=Psychroserpens sp. XS_ASV72 TaxID=3241293 RepID=UPI003511469F